MHEPNSMGCFPWALSSWLLKYGVQDLEMLHFRRPISHLLTTLFNQATSVGETVMCWEALRQNFKIPFGPGRSHSKITPDPSQPLPFFLLCFIVFFGRTSLIMYAWILPLGFTSGESHLGPCSVHGINVVPPLLPSPPLCLGILQPNPNRVIYLSLNYTSVILYL